MPRADLNKIFLISCLCFWAACGPANAGESLKTQYKAALKIYTPQKKKEVDKAILELKKSGIEKKGPKKGAQFPSFSLKNQSGEEISLAGLLKKGPLILTFFRGIWCPFCVIQLIEYQKNLELWRSLGYDLVAISPQAQGFSKDLIAQRGFTFDLLFDEDNQFARSLSISHAIPEKEAAVMKTFNINLSVFNERSTWEVPMTSTFIISQSGKVEYLHVNADHRVRAEPSEITKVLQGLKK